MLLVGVVDFPPFVTIVPGQQIGKGVVAKQVETFLFIFGDIFPFVQPV